ncbi:MAG: heme NO-binding domain-containing protein, partial [bacterium]
MWNAAPSTTPPTGSPSTDSGSAARPSGKTPLPGGTERVAFPRREEPVTLGGDSGFVSQRVGRCCVHGLIFFDLRKFADLLSTGTSSPPGLRSTIVRSTTAYLPSAVYPDAEAVSLLQSIADSIGRPLPDTLGRFGEFLAPHLVKVAGTSINPAWRTLDLIEHTESLIHSMIRAANPGAEPPVLETVRIGPDELQLVYNSPRRLCPLAKGLMRGMALHYGESIS